MKTKWGNWVFVIGAIIGGILYEQALALSLGVKGTPEINFPKDFDSAKTESIYTILRSENFEFIDGIQSYWPPEWSTTLSFRGDTANLNQFIDALTQVKKLRLKITFSQDLSKECGTALSPGSWWVKYIHTEPDTLEIRVNQAAETINLEDLEILIYEREQ